MNTMATAQYNQDQYLQRMQKISGAPWPPSHEAVLPKRPSVVPSVWLFSDNEFTLRSVIWISGQKITFQIHRHHKISGRDRPQTSISCCYVTTAVVSWSSVCIFSRVHEVTASVSQWSKCSPKNSQNMFCIPQKIRHQKKPVTKNKTQPMSFMLTRIVLVAKACGWFHYSFHVMTHTPNIFVKELWRWSLEMMENCLLLMLSTCKKNAGDVGIKVKRFRRE